MMTGLKIKILWIFLLIKLSLITSINGQKTIEFSVENYRYFTKFLLSYNQNWPFHRITLVFYKILEPKGGIEEVRMRTEKRVMTRQYKIHRLASANEETTINMIEKKMIQELSHNGILCNSLRVPTLKSFNIADFLHINSTTVQQQASLTIVIFSVNPRGAASFMQEATRVGAMTYKKVSWIVFSAQLSEIFSYQLNLSRDTQLLAVTLYTNGSAMMERWNGRTQNGTFDNTSFLWSHTPLAYTLVSPVPFHYDTQPLSVVILEDPPFLYVDSTGKKASGWLYEIWQELEMTLNFTSTFYSLPRQSEGLLQLAMDELRLGRADVVLTAAAMTVTDDIDFSFPITTQNFRFYLQRGTTTTTSSCTQFIQPFTWHVWASVCGLLALCTLLMTSTFLLGVYFGLEKPGHPIYDMRESAIVIFGSLIQQGPDYSPQGIGSRIILWSSFAFGLVIYTAYSAALISKLTVRTQDPPFKTLEGMLESSFVPYVGSGTAVHSFITNAEKGAWLDLRHRHHIVVDTPEQGIQAASDERDAAFIGDRDRVSPRIQTPPHNCRLAQVHSNILRLPASFLMRKNCPYKAAIDKQLLLMASSGALARWRDRALPLLLDDPCPIQTPLPKFGLSEVRLPFVLLGVGIAVALLVLAVEYLVKWWCCHLAAPPSPSRNRKPTRNRIGNRQQHPYNLVFLH